MNNTNTEKIIKAIGEVVGSFNKENPVPLHEPFFENSNIVSYLGDCIDSGWVSSAGKWVDKFEHQLCKFTGANYAIAVTNGTVGLRLALYVIGVRKGDEVLIPPLSFVATANSISHLNAFPHFIDIDSKTLGMCPSSLEKRLDEIAVVKNGKVFNKETNRKISAIMPVHVFGLPCKLYEIKKIADQWKIPIVEDAAEALGSGFLDEGSSIHCGLGSEIGVISFNGNKIITAGGGGALITNNLRYAKLAKHLSTTAKVPHKWELSHDQVAWNDRMPNINAALVFAQLENIKSILERKKKLKQKYKKTFKNFKFMELLDEDDKTFTNDWLITIRLNANSQSEVSKQREQILEVANSNGLLLRPAWRLLNSLSFYNQMPSAKLPKSKEEINRIINLPSSPKLMDKGSI